MKKNIYIFVLISLFYTNLIAQITPLKFDNIESIWTYYADINVADDSVVKYIPLKPIFTNNSIIFSYNLLRHNNSGYLIDKVSGNGEIIWSRRILSPNTLHREFLDFSYFNPDGNLNLLAYYQWTEKDKDGNVYDGNWALSRLSKRTIDYDSGNVIDYFLSDRTTKFSRTRKTVEFKSHIRPYRDDQTRLLAFMQGKGMPGQSESWMIKTILDETMISDTINLGLDSLFFAKRHNFYDINVDTSLLLVLSDGLVEKSDSLHLYYLDQDLKILDKLDLSSYIDDDNYHSYKIDYVDDEYIVFHSNLSFGTNVVYQKNLVKRTYYLITRTGELKEKIVVNINDYSGYKFSDSAIRLKGTNNMLILGTEYDSDGNNKSYLSRSTGLNTLDTLKIFVSASETDSIVPMQIVELNNGQILLNFEQGIKNKIVPERKFKSVWMLFDRDVLGVQTKVADVPVSINDFEISPNPTHGFLYLKLSDDTFVEKIQVLNLQGQIIKTLSYHSKIDLSSLEKGMYLLRLFGKDGRIFKTKKVCLF